jgi:hypothetical protein
MHLFDITSQLRFILVSVHHRLRLLTFPMRTVPLTQHLTARRARDVALDPGRATAPRIAVPHMLPSGE